MNWLFLRGLGRETRHWYEFPERFQAIAKGSKVLCLDLPGVGSESKKPAEKSITTSTENLRKRWLRARKDYPASEWGILGMSLGGMITLDWISRFPRDFQGAAVVNTSSKSVGSVFERLMPAGLKSLAKIIASTSPEARELEVLKMTTNTLGKREREIAKKSAGFHNENPISLKTGITQILAAAQFRLPNKIHCPLLVFASRHDQMVNPICSKRIAAKYNATLALHPDAGHDIPLEDPDWVANEMTLWMDQIQKRAEETVSARKATDASLSSLLNKKQNVHAAPPLTQ